MRKSSVEPMPAKWDWPLDAPLAIKAACQDLRLAAVTDIQALPAEPVEGTVAETIRLVPYGCTKFRISMFPVTKKAWGNKQVVSVGRHSCLPKLRLFPGRQECLPY